MSLVPATLTTKTACDNDVFLILKYIVFLHLILKHQYEYNENNLTKSSKTMSSGFNGS